MTTEKERSTQHVARGCVAQLMSVDPAVCSTAADRLVALGPPVVRFIVDDLRRDHEGLRETAAVPSLLAHFADASPAIRKTAAMVLGEIGDASAISPLLLLAFADEDVAVRQAGAEALEACLQAWSAYLWYTY